MCIIASSCAEKAAVRNVTLPSGLRVDCYEVSTSDFKEFVNKTGHQTTADSIGWSGVFDYALRDWKVDSTANWLRPEGKVIDENLPVSQVSYLDACAYCEWKKGRLPTAEEWDSMYGENSAIGNIWQGVFPLNDLAEDGYQAQAAPVGSFAPNELGIYDLRGNVWEWTSTSSGQEGVYIIKGGSFLCAENYCKGYNSAEYQTTPFDSGLNHLGFRCVYDQP